MCRLRCPLTVSICYFPANYIDLTVTKTGALKVVTEATLPKNTENKYELVKMNPNFPYPMIPEWFFSFVDELIKNKQGSSLHL